MHDSMELILFAVAQQTGIRPESERRAVPSGAL